MGIAVRATIAFAVVLRMLHAEAAAAEGHGPATASPRVRPKAPTSLTWPCVYAVKPSRSSTEDTGWKAPSNLRGAAFLTCAPLSQKECRAKPRVSGQPPPVSLRFQFRSSDRQKRLYSDEELAKLYPNTVKRFTCDSPDVLRHLRAPSARRPGQVRVDARSAIGACVLLEGERGAYHCRESAEVLATSDPKETQTSMRFLLGSVPMTATACLTSMASRFSFSIPFSVPAFLPGWSCGDVRAVSALSEAKALTAAELVDLRDPEKRSSMLKRKSGTTQWRLAQIEQRRKPILDALQRTNSAFTVGLAAVAAARNEPGAAKRLAEAEAEVKSLRQKLEALRRRLRAAELPLSSVFESQVLAPEELGAPGEALRPWTAIWEAKFRALRHREANAAAGR